MRLAAQERLGFYPAPSDAIDGLIKHLQLALPKEGDRATEHYILDPCCGEGLAHQADRRRPSHSLSQRILLWNWIKAVVK